MMLTKEIGVCQSSEDYRVLLLLHNVHNRYAKVLTFSLDYYKIQGCLKVRLHYDENAAFFALG